ncbi:MAG: hypothetical protein DRJ31_08200 [Candidatus Methanomethylicota archaeon]|uniref:Uncharacterized protein n=1 Tax=Thermoproteota archaeon TaxID=2056631 RepID=A0A497ENM2_9CREN|nr:MAG: hypothetical protein DRJ31_08200 [Candidatus Verstraetearchaeota archaeon]RLE53263.1 MAG: hypothetical protein DRJ33_01505 [Candidatus Verstraetearchaeota archaeon]
MLRSLVGFKVGSLVEVIAGVNSHYPALLGPDEPELLLTKEVAEKLGLYPPQPNWESVERLSVGGPAYGWFVRKAVRAKVVEVDREGPEVEVHAYIVSSFPKVLISDAAIKPLGIWAVDEGRGLWCFGDELRDVLDGRREPRKSYVT